MRRTLIVILFVLFTSVICFGQSSFKGLTPGKSTRAEVERLLGKPTNQVSESLFEYAQGGSQIVVQYSKSSPTAIRLQVIYSPAIERSKVLAGERLPKVADTRRTNKHGALEEYFSYPNYVVLTYDESSQTQVGQVGYYSRELFESVTPELKKAPAPATGRWSGSWTNGRGLKGNSMIRIVEDDGGLIKGDEDGWLIENGRRSDNLLTWEYRNQNNGCRDYEVRLEISPDGQTASGTYRVTDRCEKQTWVGTYHSYVRQ